MRSRFAVFTILGLAGLCLLSVLVYNLPPVQARLAWRLDALRADIKYRLNPPDEAVFVPQGQADPLTAPTTAPPTATPPPTFTATSPGPTFTPEPSPTPTETPAPLPESVILDGVVYVDQHGRWNYCGPANLTMALKFWGWPGDRDDVAAVVKPGIIDPNLDFIQRGKLDKNVMPYEMADFVTDHTGFGVVTRSGGDIELLKRLIAGGFPVLVEKGYYEADYTGKVAWMGHYLFTTGYDEATGEFIVQDAYLKPGNDMRVAYQEYIDGWRSFNYLFMVIYPPEREAEVFSLLGPWADPTWANQNALQIAEQEAQTQTGIDEFFAWFNKGTSYVNLLQYNEAGIAYDQAFQLYAQLGNDDTQRPYRILWYQTGPYRAYIYTWRYQDTINLANTTLYDTIAEPTLEESLYWRGQAYLALGQTSDAIADFRETVRLNPNFGPGLDMLAQLGVNP
jgi:hypothetical protein